MTGSSPKQGTLSAPFADRELNGESLLWELAHLREAQVRQKQLNFERLAITAALIAAVRRGAERLPRKGARP
jgi:hypothetical protein